MIDKSWEGDIQFHELAFGTWIAYLFLLYIWKRLFKAVHAEWKYALITLIAGSFYIINHYFMLAPFYYLLINSYTVVFLILYYAILVKPLAVPLKKKTAAFLSSVIFTLVYISAEYAARNMVEGRLIPGVYVPEFLILVISFLAGVLILMAHSKRG